MTVGEELRRLTGLPLFHNHLSIEAVLPVFYFGDPAFNRLVTLIRKSVVEEAAASALPGLIFTYVWAFDEESDRKYVEDLRKPFEAEGCRVVYVELWADQETRLERNAMPSRLEAKPSKRDVANARRVLLNDDERHQLSSKGDFPFEPYLFIDNTDLSAREAAEEIAEHFGLPRAGVSAARSSD